MVVLAFMTSPLAGSGAACADQPGCGASFDMADDQESPSRRVADRDETTLILGMVGISKGRGQRIVECGHGFVERHTMLLDVRCRLFAVPLEAHRTILTCVASIVRLTLPFTCGGPSDRRERGPTSGERLVSRTYSELGIGSCTRS